VKSYKERVDFFVERYLSLVKNAEKLSFPNFQLGYPNDVKKWGSVRKVIYKFAHPLFSVEKYNFWEIVGLFYLMIAALLNIGWWLMLLIPSLYAQQSFFVSHNPENITSFFLSASCALPLLVVAIYGWYDVLTSKRYRVLPRMVIIGFEIYFTWSLTSAVLAESITKHIVNSSTDIIPALLAYFIFLIPAISYFIMLFYEMFLWVLHLVDSVTKGFKSLHDPLPLNLVKELALEEIIDEGQGQTWKLRDLSMHEVQTLRKWAEANLESTDKRILPAIVVIAFLTLLLTSDAVRTWLNPFVQQWFQRIFLFWTLQSSTFTLDYFVSALICVITIMFVGFIVKTFTRLFVNLAVQSLVIETCIIVENSNDENYSATKNTSHLPAGCFWRFIRSIINLIRS